MVLFVAATIGMAVCARSCKNERGVPPRKTVIEKPTVRLDLDLDEAVENIEEVIRQADSAVMYLLSIYQEAKDSLTLEEAWAVIRAREQEKLEALEVKRDRSELDGE